MQVVPLGQHLGESGIPHDCASGHGWQFPPGPQLGQPGNPSPHGTQVPKQAHQPHGQQRGSPPTVSPYEHKPITLQMSSPPPPLLEESPPELDEELSPPDELLLHSRKICFEKFTGSHPPVRYAVT
jgi:hypothetical protein